MKLFDRLRRRDTYEFEVDGYHFRVVVTPGTHTVEWLDCPSPYVPSGYSATRVQRHPDVLHGTTHEQTARTLLSLALRSPTQQGRHLPARSRPTVPTRNIRHRLHVLGIPGRRRTKRTPIVPRTGNATCHPTPNYPKGPPAAAQDHPSRNFLSAPAASPSSQNELSSAQNPHLGSTHAHILHARHPG